MLGTFVAWAGNSGVSVPEVSRSVAEVSLGQQENFQRQVQSAITGVAGMVRYPLLALHDLAERSRPSLLAPSQRLDWLPLAAALAAIAIPRSPSQAEGVLKEPRVADVLGAKNVAQLRWVSPLIQEKAKVDSEFSRGLDEIRGIVTEGLPASAPHEALRLRIGQLYDAWLSAQAAPSASLPIDGPRDNTHLPPITPREILAFLRRIGFKEDTNQGKGGHTFMSGRDSRGKVVSTVVPWHPGDLRTSLLRKILHDIGMSRKEFMRLWRAR